MTLPHAFLASVCLVLAASTAFAAQPATGPATAPAAAAAPAERSSLWGDALGGVQARLSMPAEVEQDALVPIRLEIADDPDRLPPGADRFDTFLLQTRVAVSMTNVKTKRSVTVGPPVPANGIPTINSGNDFVRLDGTAVPPFRMQLALRRAGPALEPGEYDCVLSCPVEGGRPPWLIRPEPAGPEGGWWAAGKFQTAPLRVKVLPPTAKTRRLFLPGRAYLTRGKPDAGFALCCDKQDIEAVDVPVRNGCYLGTSVGRAGGASETSGAALSLPEGGVLFDDPTGGPVAGAEPGDELTYTAEVFETEAPPQHMWMPAPGRDGYKTLWKRSFKVKVPPASRQ